MVRLMARLRPGPERVRSVAVVASGQAFVQNLRGGHYELAVDCPPCDRVPVTFVALTATICMGPAIDSDALRRATHRVPIPESAKSGTRHRDVDSAPTLGRGGAS
jgi:hypothetical protein